MIQFEKVCKRYPGSRFVLSDISLEINRAEMVFLTGHSGAGKSTLLKLIAMLDRPSGGRIKLGGLDLATVKDRGIPWIRQRMGFVFQDFQLLNDRSVFENVALPLDILGTDHRERSRRTRAALDAVGLLGREKSRPMTLSGGEQQRVGIARAVVHRPPLVLADEPTGNLDPDMSAEIMDVFLQFNRHGTTFVIASHDLPLLKTLGKRTLVLNQGRMQDDVAGHV